jgi:hypothetical protein
MQEEDVGDGAWHNRFNRRLEDTEEGATDDERRVALLRGDPKPDTGYRHEQGRQEIHWSASIFDSKRPEGSLVIVLWSKHRGGAYIQTVVATP